VTKTVIWPGIGVLYLLYNTHQGSEGKGGLILTDKEALKLCYDALRGYMYAMTARTQRLAHQRAEEVLVQVYKNLIQPE
jgi:hypothetical protein